MAINDIFVVTQIFNNIITLKSTDYLYCIYLNVGFFVKHKYMQCKIFSESDKMQVKKCRYLHACTKKTFFVGWWINFHQKALVVYFTNNYFTAIIVALVFVIIIIIIIIAIISIAIIIALNIVIIIVIVDVVIIIIIIIIIIAVVVFVVIMKLH